VKKRREEGEGGEEIETKIFCFGIIQLLRNFSTFTHSNISTVHIPCFLHGPNSKTLSTVPLDDLAFFPQCCCCCFKGREASVLGLREANNQPLLLCGLSRRCGFGESSLFSLLTILLRVIDSAPPSLTLLNISTLHGIPTRRWQSHFQISSRSNTLPCCY
jgi:hypothetical protein